MSAVCTALNNHPHSLPPHIMAILHYYFPDSYLSLLWFSALRFPLAFLSKFSAFLSKFSAFPSSEITSLPCTSGIRRSCKICLIPKGGDPLQLFCNEAGDAAWIGGVPAHPDPHQVSYRICSRNSQRYFPVSPHQLPNTVPLLGCVVCCQKNGATSGCSGILAKPPSLFHLGSRRCLFLRPCNGKSFRLCLICSLHSLSQCCVRRAQLCGAGAIYLMCSCSKLFSDRILGAQFVYEKLLVFYLKCAACLFVCFSLRL